MYTFLPMTEADARSVLSWAYDPPYDFYNLEPAQIEEAIGETLDGSHWSVRDAEGDLAGFLSVGPTGQVPGGCTAGVYETYPGLDIGLGMRPDLTGQGRGLDFFLACVDFVRRELHAGDLRLSVATFNERAIRVYERAGFRRGPVFHSPSSAGDAEFMLMTLPREESADRAGEARWERPPSIQEN